jgi:two-component sensor histidine kinase/CheY-like chemotaxis protein
MSGCCASWSWSGRRYFAKRTALRRRNRAKSRFLAAASHDLRQPLHTVSLFSAALALQKTDPRSQQLGREIGNAIQSLGSLLDALLDISKLDADAVRPEPTRVALEKFLARIASDLRPVAVEKGLCLEVDANEHVPIETDIVLFERIVRNLADNALKYTTSGGLRLEARQSGGRAMLVVADTGQGIPREEQEHVFEEFYQLSNPERDRARGIGLGLAIVRRLTNLLSIQLTMDSEVGRGTRFVLSLPLAMPQAADPDGAPSLAAAPEDVALREARVLVVDDETSVREGMRSLLETWGPRGYSRRRDRRGAGKAERHAAGPHHRRPPRLRGRETGIELLRRARKLAGDVPALLITGDTAAQLQGEAQEMGIALLHKPVSEQALRRAIAQVLR